MKVSVASTSFKESEKKFTNHSARKTTVSKLKKTKIVSSEYIAKCHRPQRDKFPQRLR